MFLFSPATGFPNKNKTKQVCSLYVMDTTHFYREKTEHNFYNI